MGCEGGAKSTFAKKKEKQQTFTTGQGAPQKPDIL